ncbi:MAG: DNA-binding protein [Thiobacillus sp.]|nr:DNA-binding protein [Thiobacillus sp.]
MEIIETRNPLKRFKEMEELCGFSATTWNNIYHGKQKANEEHIDAVIKAFPQYRVWLGSGLTFEKEGHTSPVLERIQRDLRKAGRDAA